MADKKMKTQPNWMMLAWVIAVGYLTVMGLILNDRLWGFFTTTAELNEIGDFLAGFFAFPAFVFLAAAVMTQRQELTEARAQFEENGEQFKKNQEVIDEQLRLLDQQNKNAERQAIRGYKLDLFEYRFDIFKEVDEIARKIGERNIHEKASEAANKLSVLGHRSMFLFDDNVSIKLGSIAGKLEMLRKKKARIDSMIVPAQYTISDRIQLREGVDPEQFTGEEREHHMLIEEILRDLSFASRTNLFSKYLNVTDAMDTLIVSSGEKRNEDGLRSMASEWRNE